MVENWSYPYILVERSFVPLALFVSLVLFFELLFYGFFFLEKKYKLLIESKNILILYGFKQVMWTGLLFAFAEIDPEFILYKLIQETTIVLRQIDAFAYAVIFVIFLRGMQYRNAYTYIRRVIASSIQMNQIEIVLVIFQRFSEGEKGYLNLWVKIIFVFIYVIINIVLYIFLLLDNKQMVNTDTGMEKESVLFDLRKKQLDEIVKMIKMYSQKKQLTIFISDEWGGGKTFFAKALSCEMKKAHYNTVWIDLVDFNDQESFMKQVLNRIRTELDNNNYYTGKSSEFEKYIKTLLELSTDNKISGLFMNELKLFDEEDINSADSVSEISKQLSQMLGKELLINNF